MDRQPIAVLETALGYRFRDPNLLSQALTHSSRKVDLQHSNERMEFLGDAILGTVISEFLYRTFPDHNEGDLTRVKSVVVSRATLVRLGNGLNLGRYLDVAKGVARPTTRTHPDKPTKRPCKSAGEWENLPESLLSDAFEAIIAAVYLDGGIRAARRFIMRHMRDEIQRVGDGHDTHNYKSTLQQVVQRDMGATPVYRVTAEEGPDHVKSFDVVTLIAGKSYGSGHGKTKKAAEQMAAQETLEMLRANRG